MAVHRIIVRMYKNLLGDCFLLRIEASSGTKHILIDCGLLQGLDNTDERMTRIAENIAETAENRLDLLVVTHEHWDHISGFSQAKEIFFDESRLKIDRAWMAWTEKPGDEQAERLRARFDDRKQALTALATAMRADGATPDRSLLLRLHRFIGPSEPGSGAPGLGIVPTGRLTGRRIMTELKSAAAGVDFLEPGQITATPGEDPLRVAVLGPPRNEVRLFKDRPSSGTAKETYLAEDLLAQSILAIDGDFGEAARHDSTSPFPPHFSRHFAKSDVEAAKGAARTNTGNSDLAWLYDRYFARTEGAEATPQSYRRIDDLADGAAGLALKLDSDTNNTSLVLAFELPDKTFMLFAADAQVGNWLSWHDQGYDFDGVRLSAEAILNRTRLYKVGHHGSHNATLERQGLAMMTHPELVAMVSTVRAEAEQQGSQGWQMPDPDVAAALHASCRGRVLLGDCDWASDPDVSAEHRAKAGGFATMIDESNGLYVDYTIYAAPAAPVLDKE